MRPARSEPTALIVSGALIESAAQDTERRGETRRSRGMGTLPFSHAGRYHRSIASRASALGVGRRGDGEPATEQGEDTGPALMRGHSFPAGAELSRCGRRALRVPLLSHAGERTVFPFVQGHALAVPSVRTSAAWAPMSPEPPAKIDPLYC